jgi:hypothetical protein
MPRYFAAVSKKLAKIAVPPALAGFVAVAFLLAP